MSNYLFALIDGGGAVPPALSVAGALVRNGHDVRVLGDPVLRAEVEAVGARHIDWTTAPLRHERSKDADIVADWQARTPLGAMARTRDGFMVGPAAEYAQDTLDELARMPRRRGRQRNALHGSDARRAGGRRACRGTHHDRSAASGSRPPAVRARVHARTGTARSRAGRRCRSPVQCDVEQGAAQAQRDAGPTRPPAFQHVFEQLAGVDRIVVLTSEAFEFPGGPLPPNVRYAGPRLDDPEWVEDWTPPAGDQPAGPRRHELDLSGPCRDAAAGRGRARAAPCSRPRHDRTHRRPGRHRRAAERDGGQVRAACGGAPARERGGHACGTRDGDQVARPRGPRGRNADRPRPAGRRRSHRGIGRGPAPAPGIVFGQDRRGRAAVC